MGEQKIKKLFEEFAPVSAQTWEEQIVKDLKGADYDKKLIWNTTEGFKVKPYYRAEDLNSLDYLNSVPGEYPYVRGTKKENNSWEIRQDFKVKDPVESNKKILDAINRGATSVGLRLCKKDIETKEKFLAIIKGIDLEKIPVHFISGKGISEFLNFFIEEVSHRKIDKKKVKGSFSYNPLGHLTCKGNFYKSFEEDKKGLAEVVKKAAENLPGFRTIEVKGSDFGNAGASVVQELAFSLAIASEYLDILTSEGINADIAAKSFLFSFGIGSNYFLEIAKLRAARLLWATIVNEYKPADIKASEMFVHTETLSWNKTCYDPYVNMLRTTTEAMSASLGGCDSLTVHPFDACFAEDSEFSSRIARNTQIILKEEAYFDKISDPGGGSYYIENLTDIIIQEAWKLFIDVEESGGYFAAFKSGKIQKAIEEMATIRLNRIATRREILLGTNQYPNANEKVAVKINEEIVFNEDKAISEQVAKPVRKFRGAAEFELLRLQTEKHSFCPKVFMLTLGNPGMRKARAAFSGSFFACAGYEIIDNLGFSTVEEGVKAALIANSNIVVVCSSDEEYAELVPKAYEIIGSKAIVVVAGAPSCMDDLKAKGIQHFIHIKTNVMETLKNFHKLLKINK